MKVVWGSVGVFFSSAAYAATVIVSSDTGEIGRLDTTLGLITDVVVTNELWTDIAATSDNALFATDGLDLFEVNLSAADPVKKVGPHGLNNAQLNALAFDGADTLYAAINSDLYTVDTITGAANLVGDIGDEFDSSGDLAFADDGTLFGISSTGCSNAAVSDCLFKIDPLTGAGSFVGDIGSQFVFGLASSDGVLFAVTDADQLLEIDPDTGEGTVVGQFDQDGRSVGATGLDTPSTSQTPVVPLPASGWMLLAALGAAGAYARRSKA